MKLKLNQTNTNQFPTVGVFIEGDSIRKCLNELLEKEIDLKLCKTYLIPSYNESKLHGILIILNIEYNINLFNKHVPIQCVKGNIYIPYGSVISPELTQYDINTLFNNSCYFWHPNIGLLELRNELNWASVVQLNISKSVNVIRPKQGARIPHGIKSFNLDIDLGKLLDKIEESPFGNLFNSKDNPYFDYEKLLKGNKKELDKFLKLMHSNPELAMQYAIPLDTLNKLRVNNYANYKFNSFESKLKEFMGNFFDKETLDNAEVSNQEYKFPNSIFPYVLLGSVIFIFLLNLFNKSIANEIGFSFVFNLFIFFAILIICGQFYKPNKNKNITTNSNVNKSVINENKEKIGNNIPNKVKEYANSAFNTYLKSFSFVSHILIFVLVLFIVKEMNGPKYLFTSLLIYLIATVAIILAIYYLILKNIKSHKNKLSNSGVTSNATIMDSESFRTLREKYETMAQMLINQNDYKQASYIYYKLLTNPLKAAETLKTGKHYQDAAVMYLKKCNDKSNAAECFELAKAYKSAVDLYIELKLDEKVGDMYCLLNNRKEAMKYYKVKFDNLINENMYLSAAELAGNKMNDESLSQSTYLKGWEFGNNKVQCLYQYFKNVGDLNASLNSFYDENIKLHNSFDFLTVLKKLKKVNSEIEETSLNLAYKIISTNAHINPYIVSELLFFKNEDKQLEKDVFRFKNNNVKKKKN